MNRVIQELSRQMSSHLDAQRNGVDKDGRGSDTVQVRLRKQLADSQAELKTERSLHEITKTSLQALEEDCQWLRNQLISYRRREPHTSEKYVLCSSVEFLHFFKISYVLTGLYNI